MEQNLPAPYQNMTAEKAMDEVFDIMLKKYGKTKHKLITSRQSTKEILRGIAGLNENQTRDQLREIIQILLDMFDITEITLDHAHSAKLIYGVYKRSEKIDEITIKQESVESYLAFHQGRMIPLRHDDTIEQLYTSIYSKGLRNEPK